MIQQEPTFIAAMKQIGIAAGLEACKHVGKKELNGKNDGPFVESVLGDKSGLPWCSAFVLRVYEWAGHKLPVNFWECRRVSTLYAAMEEAGALLRADECPMIGDLAFWLGKEAHAAAGSSGHVGVVIARYTSGVEIVEGNAGNAVRRRRYDLGAPAITAFARPSLCFIVEDKNNPSMIIKNTRTRVR